MRRPNRIQESNLSLAGVRQSIAYAQTRIKSEMYMYNVNALQCALFPNFTTDSKKSLTLYTGICKAYNQFLFHSRRTVSFYIIMWDVGTCVRYNYTNHYSIF